MRRTTHSAQVIPSLPNVNTRHGCKALVLFSIFSVACAADGTSNSDVPETGGAVNGGASASGEATSGGTSTRGGAENAAGAGRGGQGGTSTSVVSCEQNAYCLDDTGAAVADCNSRCGGISLMGCPNDSLVCLDSMPSMWNDGAIRYCVAARAVDCEEPADCACLPGNCSMWGGAAAVKFSFTCEAGKCVGHCL
jgi:hypothetical protein